MLQQTYSFDQLSHHWFESLNFEGQDCNHVLEYLERQIGPRVIADLY
jgi:hypothetical protein